MKEVVQFYIDGSHNTRNKNLLVYGIMMSEEHGEHFLIDKKCCKQLKKELRVGGDVSFGCTDSELYSFYTLVNLIKSNKHKFKNKSIQIFTDSQSVQMLFFGDSMPKSGNRKMKAIYTKTMSILLNLLKELDIDLFHINGHKDCWGNLAIDNKMTKWLRRFNLNYIDSNNKNDLVYDTLSCRLKSTSF